MPRPRNTIVTEPGEHLATLHLGAQNADARARIAMLLLLKNDHSLTLEDVAERLGRSISTIKRWWKIYSDGGLEFLLKNGVADDTLSLSGVASDLLLLHAKILNGEFATLEGVQQWISSTSGMPTGEATGSAAGALPPNAADLLLRFFELLPRSTGLTDWVEGFRTVMHTLLPDVDHISVSFNTECDLRTPEQYRPALAVVQEASEQPAPLRIDEETDDPLSRVLASCRRQNFPFEQYHPHHGFVYYHAGAYLGTIILWRERHRPRSFDHGLALMRTLQDLLAFLLADAIRRIAEDRALPDPPHPDPLPGGEGIRNENKGREEYGSRIRFTTLDFHHDWGETFFPLSAKLRTALPARPEVPQHTADPLDFSFTSSSAVCLLPWICRSAPLSRWFYL